MRGVTRCDCGAVNTVSVKMPDGRRQKMCQDCRGAWKRVQKQYGEQHVQQNTLSNSTGSP